jgi:hypothetical protein
MMVAEDVSDGKAHLTSPEERYVVPEAIVAGWSPVFLL